MATYYVDPEQGNDANNGTSTSTPWRLIPGQTGANAVTAGDTINVKNGTRSSNGRIIFTANDLTYRGYGLASNILKLKLPAKNPSNIVIQTTCREVGVHEGMWTLYEPTETNTIITFSTRSGCVVEDVEVIAPQSSTAISMGFSTSTAIGVTLRRSKVVGAAATGIGAYSRQVLIEDCEVGYTLDDAITIGASVENGYRTGYADIVRRVSVLEPGMDETAAIGDALQTFASSSRFESSLLIEDFYVYKPNAVKQAIVISDVLGGFLLQRFHFSSTDRGHAQILFSGIGSTAVVRDGYIEKGCAANAVVRYAGSQGIETGATLTIQNIVVNAPQNSGFFTWGGSENVATVDGVVTITNCTLLGTNTQNLSFSGGISSHPGANITIGANASIVAKNNCIISTGQPLYRLPTGGANNAKWLIQNNATNGGTFAIGSTSYTTLTSFEAAHSAATNNIDSDPLLSSIFRPKVNSPLIETGVFTKYETDLEGVQRNNPPSIGAYEYIAERADAGTRGVR